MKWTSFDSAESEIRSTPGRTRGEYGVDLASAIICRGRWDAETSAYIPDENGSEILVWDPDHGYLWYGSIDR
ncbi:MAG: hypothetical protein ACK44H_10810 [Candidatus Kryptonium sp.]